MQPIAHHQLMILYINVRSTITEGVCPVARTSIVVEMEGSAKSMGHGHVTDAAAVVLVGNDDDEAEERAVVGVGVATGVVMLQTSSTRARTHVSQDTAYS